MTKNEYLEELKQHLSALPEDEINDIIEYFSEFFEDSDKNTEEIISSLDCPREVANKIISNMELQSNTEQITPNHTTNTTSEKQTSSDSNGEFDLDGISNIDLDLKNSKFIFNTSTTGKNTFKIIKEENSLSTFTHKIENGVFTLQEKIKFDILKLFFYKSNKVIISVTNDFDLNNLNIISKHGSIDINELRANNVFAKVINGRFSISNSKFNALDVTTTNGKIDFDTIEANNITVNSLNGSINFDHVYVENQLLKTCNGSINVSCKANTTDANSVNGSISIKGNVDNDLNATTTNGSINIKVNNIKKAVLKSSTGSINVDALLDGVLNTTTNTGSININPQINANDFDLQASCNFGKIKLNNVTISQTYITNNNKANKIIANTNMGSINID